MIFKKNINILKRIFIFILVLIITNSCLIMKIDKDSKPLVDFGTPLIGHYRNGDTPKAVLYTVLFVSSIIGIIIFAPTQPSENNEYKSVLRIDRNISDPLFISFIAGAGTSFAASSIDSAATYHIGNNKIIKLNDIEWDPKLKKMKYQVIRDFQENKLNEDKKEEIEYYKKQLIEGTVTEDELLFIENSDFLKKQLAKELGYYYINKEINEKK